MSAKVVPFDSNWRALSGAQKLVARKKYREVCKTLAADVIPKAFSDAGKLSGHKGLSVDDALPVFVAAMRRELRKSGWF